MSFWSIQFLICCVFQVLSEPIIGGANAPPRRFSYQVSLQNEDGHFCGGSIISKSWVLTAAHCLVDTDIIRVVTGTVHQEDGGTRHAVKSIFIHEDYNDTTLVNDIAVVELQNIIHFDMDTRAIKLAIGSPPSEAYTTATGWGYYNETVSIYSNRLQMLTVKTISFSECLKYEPIDPNEPWLKLIRGKHFCLMNRCGEGPCNGDSGSPIAWNGAQIGLITFGAEKCAIGKPVACISISGFRYWIFKKTGV